MAYKLIYNGAPYGLNESGHTVKAFRTLQGLARYLDKWDGWHLEHRLAKGPGVQPDRKRDEAVNLHELWRSIGK